jgi:hypothetical protein
MKEIKLLDPEELNSSFNCEKCRPYFEYLIKNGSSELIKNVDLKLRVLQVGEQFLPICITDFKPGSSCIYSICGGMECTKDIFLKQCGWIGKTIARPILDAAIHLIAQFNFDRKILVDYLPFLGSKYLQAGEEDWQRVTRLLTKEFPDHAICFHTVNSKLDAPFINQLKLIGYQFLPGKQSIIIDATQDFRLTNSSKNDLRLEKKTSFQKVVHDEITPDDYSRIVELYNMLFLEKYSKASAQITENLIKLFHECKILDFKGLRNSNGILEGIVGIFVTGDRMYDPIIGYNLQLPKQLGIYRILKAMELQYAIAHKLIHNSGAGAMHFKQLRGGVPSTELTACFYQHLPRERQRSYRLLKIAWQILRYLITGETT